MMASPATGSDAFIQGLWILYRLKALPDDILEKALLHSDPMVQAHALRVLAEMKKISPRQHELLVQAMSSKEPRIRRVAVEAIKHFPQYATLQPLVDLYNNTDSIDTHLRYATLLAIRDHLENTAILQQAEKQKWTEDQLKTLAFIMTEVPSRQGAYFSLNYLKNHELTGRQLQNNLKYISRYVSPASLDELITLTRARIGSDTAIEYKLFQAVSEGVAQKGAQPTAKLKQWDERMSKLRENRAKYASSGEFKLDTSDRRKIINERLASYDPSSVTVEHGKEVFIKNCTMCHHIGNEPGGSIGPSLSGIGTWGQRALTEKILNPNGSISTAFRTYNITLKDGRKLSGLFRRQDGKVLVFADFTGQEFIVPEDQIKEKVESKYTLMPDSFRNTIAKKDFDALIKYLLTIKDK
jgi:putative heme-binding domain-containing protein